MPRAAASRRVDQCVYVENGRRCRRSASGTVPICNPHKIAVAESVRKEATRGAGAVGDGVAELLDRVLNRKKVSKKVFDDAMGDVVNLFEQYQQRAQQRAQQPPPHPGSADERRANGAYTWYDGILNDFRQRVNPHGRPPPPPVDPHEADRRARVLAARQLMGFTPTESLTEDMIKKRYRELARKHHPDRGGSVTKMQEINVANDVLLASLTKPPPAG